MAFWEDFSKKVKDVAAITAEKTKDVAAAAGEAAKDAAELAKINVAIAGEQREIDKNCRTIGEWFVTEYDGELPEAVKGLADAIAASKAKIAELEASKPKKDEGKAAAPVAQAAEEIVEEVAEAAEEVIEEIKEAVAAKKCPVCGAETDSRFCPQCGAPVDE